MRGALTSKYLNPCPCLWMVTFSQGKGNNLSIKGQLSPAGCRWRLWPGWWNSGEPSLARQEPGHWIWALCLWTCAFAGKSVILLEPLGILHPCIRDNNNSFMRLLWKVKPYKCNEPWQSERQRLPTGGTQAHGRWFCWICQVLSFYFLRLEFVVDILMPDFSFKHGFVCLLLRVLAFWYGSHLLELSSGCSLSWEPRPQHPAGHSAYFPPSTWQERGETVEGWGFEGRTSSTESLLSHLLVVWLWPDL